MALREELRAVPRAVLEDYVSTRVQQFSRVFAGHLLPGATEQAYEYAYAKTLQSLGSTPVEQRSNDTYLLKFRHKCRFFGCLHKDCQLCKNNPNKRCGDDDSFDECFADGQILKSKCEAEVYLELVNARTGAVDTIPGVEFVVSVVDGESYSESAPSNYSHTRELLKNDDGNVLLGAYQGGSKADPDGRLYLKMQDGLGQVKLPDVCVTDKNDTFHLRNETYSSFRLMAKAVRRDVFGSAQPVDNVLPCVSGKFIVKTQRALNDYRKSDYPHFKDELTKLKHIGSITAQRLREIQQHLDCPYSSIETVEQLKMLVQYADQNRQVENKMLELLNMKGKHKHKWDYLREVMMERVVYDDVAHRVWWADDAASQGVLFACKQGQANMDRPVGIVQRAANGRLLAAMSPSGQEAEVMKQWRAMAEVAWYSSGHRGWSVLQEPLEVVGGGGSGSMQGGGGSVSMAPTPSMSMSMADAMDDQVMVARRGSTSVATGMGPPPLMLGEVQSGRSRRSSACYASSPDVSGHVGMGMGFLQPQASTASIDAAQHHIQVMQAAAAGQSHSSGGGGPYSRMSAPAPGGAGGMHTQAQLQALDFLGVDVYRTSSVPNLRVPGAPFAAQPLSPVHARSSAEYSTGGEYSLGGEYGGGSEYSTDGGGGAAGQPQVRPARHRRMSADASAVRQMAMMNAAALQGTVSADADSSGKRGRNNSNSAPGQGNPANDHDNLLQLQSQLQGLGGESTAGGGGSNRHALYHAESRGRHTPRSRLSAEISDTVAAAALGAMLETSDIEAYLAQNFSFLAGGNDPAAAAAAEANLLASLSGGSGTGPGLSASALFGGGSLSGGGGGSMSGGGGSMSGGGGVHPELLTGQMQNTLIINDGASPRYTHHHAHHHHAPPQPVGTLFQNLQHHSQQQQQQLEAAHGDTGDEVLPSSGSRKLQHCESDSFKRFLAVGLPFAPMDPTPEGLYEGSELSSRAESGQLQLQRNDS